jgi:hypothetical protein
MRDNRMLATVSVVAALAVVGASGATDAGQPADVRVRAVELAPEDPMPGGTYVILENRGSARVGLGCWRLRTSRSVLTIRRPTVIPARAGLRLFFGRGEIGNPDRVSLLSPAGRVVDATPLLNDTKADDQLFGRRDGGWTLGRGPLPATVVDGTLVRHSRSGC